MLNRIRKRLAENGILLAAPISLSRCTVNKPYLLERIGIGMQGTAVIFAIPYHTPQCEHPDRNLSRYAVSRDYHLFVRQLADRLVPLLAEDFPSARFALFADHSPLDERDAAVKAGLGTIGSNRLLITQPYGSYVFLGSLITDLSLPEDEKTQSERQTCLNCGACLAACPYLRGDSPICLSALTQKKGELTPEEEDLLIRYGSVWGCDICQQVCPHNRAAIDSGTVTSPIEFFHHAPLARLTYSDVEKMSDAEFSERAYAWRGREVILRNLAAMEQQDANQPQDHKKHR